MITAGLLALASCPPVFAQEIFPAANSFYDKAQAKEYQLGSIYLGGEVENPGTVEFSLLPVREVAVKELAFEAGRPEFKGAYFFSGYSLYDILNVKAAKKTTGDFKPEVDLFVIVENDKGEKAVFSWGEIYYAQNSFTSLIYKSARPINPSQKNITWPLPEAPRLVCSADLYNTRFIANPSKITVSSAPGDYPGRRHSSAYSPEFEIIAGGKTTIVKKPLKLTGKRGYVYTGYGHGRGFKGLKTPSGMVFKDFLAAAGVIARDCGSALVIVSSRDSYRAVFSLSEIINRGDNADFLLLDRGRDKEGRFSLFSAADFFVDRNVRSVAKVEVLKI